MDKGFIALRNYSEYLMRIIVLFVYLLASCFSDVWANDKEVFTVGLPINIEKFHDYSGEVFSKTAYFIGSETSGRLRYVLEKGKFAKQNEILFEIDTEYDKALLAELNNQLGALAKKRNMLVDSRHKAEQLLNADAVLKGTSETPSLEVMDIDIEISEVRQRVILTKDIIKRKVISAWHDGYVIDQFFSSGDSVETGDSIIHFLEDRELYVSVQIPSKMVSEYNFDWGGVFIIEKLHMPVNFDYVNKRIERSTGGVELSLKLPKNEGVVLGNRGNIFLLPNDLKPIFRISKKVFFFKKY